jgi:hypothetical protein
MPAFANTFNDKEIKELADYVKQGIPPTVTAQTGSDSQRHHPLGSLHLVIDTVVTGRRFPGDWHSCRRQSPDLGTERETAHLFTRETLSPIEGLPPIMALAREACWIWRFIRSMTRTLDLHLLFGTRHNFQ